MEKTSPSVVLDMRSTAANTVVKETVENNNNQVIKKGPDIISHQLSSDQISNSKVSPDNPDHSFTSESDENNNNNNSNNSFCLCAHNDNSNNNNDNTFSRSVSDNNNNQTSHSLFSPSSSPYFKLLLSILTGFFLTVWRFFRTVSRFSTFLFQQLFSTERAEEHLTFELLTPQLQTIRQEKKLAHHQLLRRRHRKKESRRRNKERRLVTLRRKTKSFGTLRKKIEDASPKRKHNEVTKEESAKLEKLFLSLGGRFLPKMKKRLNDEASKDKEAPPTIHPPKVHRSRRRRHRTLTAFFRRCLCVQKQNSLLHHIKNKVLSRLEKKYTKHLPRSATRRLCSLAKGNINSKNLATAFRMILLLSGDIEANPGPSPRNNRNQMDFTDDDSSTDGPPFTTSTQPRIGDDENNNNNNNSVPRATSNSIRRQRARSESLQSLHDDDSHSDLSLHERMSKRRNPRIKRQTAAANVITPATFSLDEIEKVFKYAICFTSFNTSGARSVNHARYEHCQNDFVRLHMKLLAGIYLQEKDHDAADMTEKKDNFVEQPATYRKWKKEVEDMYQEKENAGQTLLAVNQNRLASQVCNMFTDPHSVSAAQVAKLLLPQGPVVITTSGGRHEWDAPATLDDIRNILLKAVELFRSKITNDNHVYQKFGIDPAKFDELIAGIQQHLSVNAAAAAAGLRALDLTCSRTVSNFLEPLPVVGELPGTFSSPTARRAYETQFESSDTELQEALAAAPPGTVFPLNWSAPSHQTVREKTQALRSALMILFYFNLHRQVLKKFDSELIEKLLIEGEIERMVDAEPGIEDETNKILQQYNVKKEDLPKAKLKRRVEYVAKTGVTDSTEDAAQETTVPKKEGTMAKNKKKSDAITNAKNEIEEFRKKARNNVNNRIKMNAGIEKDTVLSDAKLLELQRKYVQANCGPDAVEVQPEMLQEQCEHCWSGMGLHKVGSPCDAFNGDLIRHFPTFMRDGSEFIKEEIRSAFYVETKLIQALFRLTTPPIMTIAVTTTPYPLSFMFSTPAERDALFPEIAEPFDLRDIEIRRNDIPALTRLLAAKSQIQLKINELARRPHIQPDQSNIVINPESYETAEMRQIRVNMHNHLLSKLQSQNERLSRVAAIIALEPAEFGLNCEVEERKLIKDDFVEDYKPSFLEQQKRVDKEMKQSDDEIEPQTLAVLDVRELTLAAIQQCGMVNECRPFGMEGYYLVFILQILKSVIGTRAIKEKNYGKAFLISLIADNDLAEKITGDRLESVDAQTKAASKTRSSSRPKQRSNQDVTDNNNNDDDDEQSNNSNSNVSSASNSLRSSRSSSAASTSSTASASSTAKKSPRGKGKKSEDAASPAPKSPRADPGGDSGPNNNNDADPDDDPEQENKKAGEQDSLVVHKYAVDTDIVTIQRNELYFKLLVHDYPFFVLGNQFSFLSHVSAFSQRRQLVDHMRHALQSISKDDPTNPGCRVLKPKRVNITQRINETDIRNRHTHLKRKADQHLDNESDEVSSSRIGFFAYDDSGVVIGFFSISRCIRPDPRDGAKREMLESNITVNDPRKPPPTEKKQKAQVSQTLEVEESEETKQEDNNNEKKKNRSGGQPRPAASLSEFDNAGVLPRTEAGTGAMDISKQRLQFFALPLLAASNFDVMARRLYRMGKHGCCDLCHRCLLDSCVNPDHCLLGKGNINKSHNHCKKGHCHHHNDEFDKESHACLHNGSEAVRTGTGITIPLMLEVLMKETNVYNLSVELFKMLRCTTFDANNNEEYSLPIARTLNKMLAGERIDGDTINRFFSNNKASLSKYQQELEKLKLSSVSRPRDMTSFAYNFWFDKEDQKDEFFVYCCTVAKNIIKSQIDYRLKNGITQKNHEDQVKNNIKVMLRDLIFKGKIFALQNAQPVSTNNRINIQHDHDCEYLLNLLNEDDNTNADAAAIKVTKEDLYNCYFVPRIGQNQIFWKDEKSFELEFEDVLVWNDIEENPRITSTTEEYYRPTVDIKNGTFNYSTSVSFYTTIFASVLCTFNPTVIFGPVIVGSHRCGCGLCVNPFHVVFELSCADQSRKYCFPTESSPCSTHEPSCFGVGSGSNASHNHGISFSLLDFLKCTDSNKIEYLLSRADIYGSCARHHYSQCALCGDGKPIPFDDLENAIKEGKVSYKYSIVDDHRWKEHIVNNLMWRKDGRQWTENDTQLQRVKEQLKRDNVVARNPCDKSITRNNAYREELKLSHDRLLKQVEAYERMLAPQNNNDAGQMMMMM